MTGETITVKERKLWVFNLPLPKDAAFAEIQEPNPKWDEDGEHILWPMGVALGVPYLDHDTVEPLWIEDLETPLSDQVLGMTRADPDTLAPHKDMLDAATGLVIFLSLDLDDTAPSRTPDAPYRFLGVYKQDSYSFTLGAPAPSNDPSQAASTTPSAAQPPAAPQSPKRNALVAGVILATAVLAIAIYMALT